MKHVLMVFLLFSPFAANAMQVAITCSTRAYSCSGPYCQWVTTGTPTTVVAPMYRDPNYPSPGYPYEVFRGNYRTVYDNHVLTLAMSVSSADPGAVNVQATLDGGRVFAETWGRNQADVSLRNSNFGRGFHCSPINVIN